MKRKIISSTALICILLLTFGSLFSCESSGAKRLGTPAAELVGNTLTWEPVTDAIGYEIDTGAEVVSVMYDCFEYVIAEGSTVRVRAVGDGTVYETGKWSKSFTYIKNAHAHTDVGDDGLCDTCGTEIIIVVDLYAINDLHGKFCDTDGQPGVDELATYLKNAKKTDDYAVILSTGDMWQGSAESNLSGGLIMTEWMNELGFASMTIGNHEFDWGEERIRTNLEEADFPFLAINIYDKDTDELADYCTPSAVVDLGALQIGIIGAIGDCYSSISPDMVEGVYFKTGSDLTALVNAEADKLRAEGADLIVYSLHDGYTSNRGGVTEISTTQLATYYQSSLGDHVDVVFEGHTHKSYVLCDTRDTYHLQGGGENRGISHIELEISLVTGAFEVNLAEIVESYEYANLVDDSATEALEDKYADIIDMAYDELGVINKRYTSSELSSLVAELYLEAGIEKWGDKYDIVLGGGYINARSPYELAKGTACYADVLSIYPFDNRLTLCAVKGEQLLSKFINNSSYYIHLSEYGESIKNKIDRNATYYIVVDTYTQLYSPNRLTLVEYYDGSTYARDLLADAVRDGRLGARLDDED